MSLKIPATAVIPTADRAEVLRKTLESLAAQQYQPEAIILVDASGNEDTKLLCETGIKGLLPVINYQRAAVKGAASQRNQAVALVESAVVFFMDDDITFQPGCIEAMWNCLQSDKTTGAVNAMIINQQYHEPGKLTRFMYHLLSGEKMLSYAGKCIGPAWNLLPEDKDDLPGCNEVEWLNTTCTMYKISVLPDPPFPDLFKGYSLLEDVALSLTIAKKHRLFNARYARIYHDSQRGIHKNSVWKLAKMELVNRHYVMTAILKRNKFADYLKLVLFEIFGMVTVLTTLTGWKNLLPAAFGKFAAIGSILFTKNEHE